MTLPTDFYPTPAHDLANVLTTGHALAKLTALPHPWPEHEDLEGMGVGVCKSPTAIPTLANDSLLTSVRGRWRMPRALTRSDFERTFRAKEHAATFESVLALVRAGTWSTQAAMARHYGKPAYWVRSLMWCALREHCVTDYATWQRYFTERPKRSATNRKRRTPTYKASPSDAGASEPFRLPDLDAEDLDQQPSTKE